ncbi:MAG: winged helix-turn-helix transcriptional regulator [Myxococcales bacterium]|nr:winged helix-turn-helix transcriptional regulator [Myxococcales bacterium]
MTDASAPCCPPAEPTPPVPLDEHEADAQLARLARALGHPARVAILRMLVRREGCIVSAIVDELPLAQSTVSQHLKQLKDAGLIRGDIDGPRICYCVEPGAVALLDAGAPHALTPEDGDLVVLLVHYLKP